MKRNSYEKRKCAERDQTCTRMLEKNIKQEIISKTVAKQKQQLDFNKVKAGQYQIIKDSTKIRKYDKKARMKVMKMSPEMIDSLISRKSATQSF